MTANEYTVRGDYHRNPARNWTYYPIYVEKLRRVDRFLSRLPRTARILDLGCGEGVLVEKYRHLGYQITGLDLHYESDYVMQGDLRESEFPDASFDVILCLDVIEHLTFSDQERALREIQRLLKQGGHVFVTVPNLAHFSSRLAFLFTGKLLRTSSIERHPGDRPLGEYRKLFGKYLKIQQVRGIFPTLPISSLLTLLIPGKIGWWHRILTALVPIPGWCFLNVFLLEKPVNSLSGRLDVTTPDQDSSAPIQHAKRN